MKLITRVLNTRCNFENAIICGKTGRDKKKRDKFIDATLKSWNDIIQLI